MNNDLEICVIGGLEKDGIGKNCLLIKAREEIIVIDCGMKFHKNDSDINLIDGEIPDLSYIIENKKKIRGLFITHGHEDHIGAIPYLLSQAPEIPVFGSDFSISLLKQKLKNQTRNKFNIFRKGTVVKTGEFRVKFFCVTHSIPGSFGVIVEVLKENKRIVATGDFKFDWTSIGDHTDLFELHKCAEEGIDLLFSDSTNAEKEGNTLPESKVINNLRSVIKKAKGRVIVTSFASNVNRLKEIIEIAKEDKRKIVLLGSSLLKMIKVIQKASLWKIDGSVFLKASAIGKTPHNKLIIFCTGSQGEEKAVLSRLANQTYPDWKVEAGDSLIFTSSPIMDNRSKVEILTNGIYTLGAEIFENSLEYPLHTSGHASQRDLELMLRITNPKHFFPYHGNFRMLKSHAKLAEGVGVDPKRIFVCENGQILELGKDGFLLTNRTIQIKPTYVFGGKIVPREHLFSNIEVRRSMFNAGVFIVLFFLEKENSLKRRISPYIFTYGFTNMKKNETMINIWKSKIAEFFNEKRKNKFEIVDLENSVFSYIKENLFLNWKDEKKPLIKVIIREK